ncbi:MAG: hypothetical protein RL011_2397 [Pseudomonadota bacterium]
MAAHDHHNHNHAAHDHHGHKPGHHHHHHHGHHHDHRAVSNLKVALFLNLGFALVEIVGGIWTGSVAILSDAVHDLGDAMALGSAYVFERIAGRQPSSTYSYGYRRLSLLSAVFTAAFLLVGSAFVLAEAIPRLMAPTMPKLPGMLGFAVLGVAVNGYAAWRLVRGGGTMNERVISWHLIEDVLGWLTVLIGTVVMMVVDLPIIDPILSIIFSLFIVYNVMRSLGATIRLFLQAVPRDIDLEGLRRDITGIEAVESTHDFHLWSLDGERHVLTVHVVVEQDLPLSVLETVKKEIRQTVAKHGNIHVTVELEPKSGTCENNCHI